MAWNQDYRRLSEGELIQIGDEIQNDDGSWKLAKEAIGKTAPNPNYTSHRIYRRKL